jgi:hypothetical protein
LVDPSDDHLSLFVFMNLPVAVAAALIVVTSAVPPPLPAIAATLQFCFDV